MSVWDEVAVVDGPVTLLQGDIASGRIAHAYLFAGVAGRLPADAALGFGAALVCPDGGCGRCDACARVRHRAHPDVEVIEPAGVQLLVDQVREAIRSASRRPVAAPRRVIVVEGADRMNPTAQNAFLKALEEPPPSTTIILIAPNPEVLLETVRSRCREVTFHSPPPAEVASLLERRGVGADDARYCARVGGGLERAVTLATDTEARALRDELVERVLEPFRDPGEALEAAVDDVSSVLRDLLAVLGSEDAELLNESIRAKLVQQAGALSAGAQGRIVAALSEVERCRRRLRLNANVLLTLEELFLALFRYVS